MCGRLNVTSDPLTQIVSAALGIKFTTETNTDLRPTQKVAAIGSTNSHLSQLDVSWGIKPQWAKKLLINAQSETVAEKPTFRKAFAQHRCVIPCSGWYEWSGANGGAKTKYLFQGMDGQPVYMAGIWYEPEVDGELPKLVTLTTKPTEECAQYHHRMPLVLPEEAVSDWVLASADQVVPLLALGGPKVDVKLA